MYLPQNTPTECKCDFKPMPDNMSSLGESTAPALTIISFRALQNERRTCNET